MATPELCASKVSSVLLGRFCVLCDERGGVGDDKQVRGVRGERGRHVLSRLLPVRPSTCACYCHSGG